VLRANQINLWMEDDEKTPILLKARRLVRGRVASNLTGGTLGPVRFQGRWLVGYFKPGSRDLDHLELSGPAIEPALVLTRAPGEAPRRLLASRLIGSFQGGALSRAEAVGGVRLAELRREPPDEDWTHFTPSADTDSLDAEGEDEEEDEPGEQAGPLQGVSLDISPRPFDSFEEDALRVATAPRAEAVLGAEGGLVEVLLTGEVWIRDQRYTAQGNQARFDYANGVGEFLGTPATVVASQGEIKAPRFLYTERSGLLFASGGTRSQLKQDPKGGAGLAAGPLGKGEGPVWVESQEAFFRQSDRTFLFRGKVKAWRGENLLRADEMQGDEASGRLSAKGNVNTLVIG
ncbi:MAG TPA: hypothetical protein PK413_22035, partial [Thermoanaerobaculia bacterium]|nr:hypothetical protein [Thermoanaerobaculia bacterium]